jgi:hypothetical protein
MVCNYRGCKVHPKALDCRPHLTGSDSAQRDGVTILQALTTSNERVVTTRLYKQKINLAVLVAQSRCGNHESKQGVYLMALQQVWMVSWKHCEVKGVLMKEDWFGGQAAIV